MPTPKLSQEEKLERSVQRLRDENHLLRKTNRKLHRVDTGYHSFLEGLEEFVEKDRTTLKFIPDPAPKVPKSVLDPSHVEVAVAAVSDLHLGEVTVLRDTNYINEYNAGIGASRMWEHVQKLKSLIRRHQHLYTIDHIWVPLLGDIINGSIHPDHIRTNDLTDEAAVVLAVRLLRMFFEELKTLGLRIDIDAVHGNHPRTTVKMPTKRQAYTNRDWVIYEMLADHFREDPLVNVVVCTSQIGMRRVCGHNYVFEHGMGVGNGNEESFEDRIRAIFDDPVHRRATGLKGASFDQIVIGNMHKAKFLERTVVNGCYPGQNELGQSWRLKPISASQQLWGVCNKHARTWQYTVDMTDVKKVGTDPFAQYAKLFLTQHGIRS